MAAPDHPTLLPALLLTDPDDIRAGRAPRTTRDWIVDVITFVFSVGMAVLMYWLIRYHGRGPGPVLNAADIVFTVLACAGLWWRRRWPAAFGLVSAAAGLFSVYSMGAGMVYLFTVAVHRRFPVAAAVALLTIAASVPNAVINPDPGASILETLAWTIGSIAVITGWGMFARARRQLILSLRDRAVRAEKEQRLRADQARRAERARIAREMHDVLAHRISLLSTYAGALEYRKGASAEEVAQAAGVIRASAHQALEDLREVIGVLRGDEEDDAPDRPQPTAAELPTLVEESKRAGVRVTLGGAADLDAIPAAVGRATYRIVQEGLTNARKHAPGTTVTVLVDGGTDDGLTVEVRNRMPVGGGAAIPGAGMGLVGLAERASLAGGRLESGPAADGDFSLRAWLPWAP